MYSCLGLLLPSLHPRELQTLLSVQQALVALSVSLTKQTLHVQMMPASSRLSALIWVGTASPGPQQCQAALRPYHIPPALQGHASFPEQRFRQTFDLSNCRHPVGLLQANLPAEKDILHDCLDNSVIGETSSKTAFDTDSKTFETSRSGQSISKYASLARQTSSGKQIHRE